VLTAIDLRKLPGAAGNKIYLDYIAGMSAAAEFYTHPPLDFAGALAQRRERAYPRRAVTRQLADYNARLGAHPRALAHIDAVYTAYKIITAIRLADYFEQELGARAIPVFWLASEDHDFGEINHAYVLKGDGEIGRVRFSWRQEGRPIADLPITDHIKRANDEYFQVLLPTPHTRYVRDLYAFQVGEGFAGWQARIWSQLFSARGLVVVEPHIVRAAVPEFFVAALEHVDEIEGRLGDVAQRLTAAGYVPALSSDHAGCLYTFDEQGRRVRVQAPREHVAEAALNPERYSTDAALRPLFADAALPVVASVLGPGEMAYQAMLKPLYELFSLTQPLLFPRKSYTIVAAREADRLAHYRTDVSAVLGQELDLDAVLSDLVPDVERELFRSAHREVAGALSPLHAYLEGVDPSLIRTWTQTVAASQRSLDKLEQRAFKARMGQLGFSKKDLRGAQNALLPRGRLQERIFPLAHLLNGHGPGFIDNVFSAGALEDFGHHILMVENDDA
jgi:bacillithiol biosynthesis cysteine-adding enzyme BshC